MKLRTACTILTLIIAPAARAQPAPLGRLIITEHAIRQYEPGSAHARLADAPAQMVTANKAAKIAAAVSLGFVGFLVGGWLGQAAGGGGEQGLPDAFIGASVGALVGVLIAMK